MHPGSGGCSFAKLTPRHHHSEGYRIELGDTMRRGNRSPPPTHITCCSPPGQAVRARCREPLRHQLWG